jgi:hypothetical protein
MDGYTSSHDRIRVAMTNDTFFGVVLGALICAVVIGGNVRRSDPHLVSVYPDVVSVAVAPIAVYLAARRRRLRGQSSEAVQAFGVRIGAIAGAVFATGFGTFTSFWLAAWPLSVFVTGAAFGSVFLLSFFSAYAAGRTRVMAV